MGQYGGVGAQMFVQRETAACSLEPAQCLAWKEQRPRLAEAGGSWY